MGNVAKAIQNEEVQAKEKAEVDTKKVENELAVYQNTGRLLGNTLTLIEDEAEFKGGFAKAVAEVTDFLRSMKNDVSQRIKTLEALLPKPEAAKEPEKATEPTEAKQGAQDAI